VCGRGRTDTLEPGRGAIDTHGEIVVAETGLEGACIVVGRHIPEATHNVVDVLAILSSVGTCACAEAEFSVGDERSPFVVLEAGAKCIPVDETTNRVTVTVSTMGVELASLIAAWDVDVGKLALTSPLDIIGCLDKVNTSESTVGDETTATARSSAPCDLVTLGIANGADLGGSPETEVVDGVHPDGLAHAGLRRCGATVINARLTAF